MSKEPAGPTGFDPTVSHGHSKSSYDGVDGQIHYAPRRPATRKRRLVVTMLIALVGSGYIAKKDWFERLEIRLLEWRCRHFKFAMDTIMYATDTDTVSHLMGAGLDYRRYIDQQGQLIDGTRSTAAIRQSPDAWIKLRGALMPNTVSIPNTLLFLHERRARGSPAVLVAVELWKPGTGGAFQFTAIRISDGESAMRGVKGAIQEQHWSSDDEGFAPLRLGDSASRQLILWAGQPEEQDESRFQIPLTIDGTAYVIDGQVTGMGNIVLCLRKAVGQDH